MGFDLRRMIANAVVRRVVYVLVALVLASVGIGRAQAQDATCNNTAIIGSGSQPNVSPICSSREVAYTTLQAFIDAEIARTDAAIAAGQQNAGNKIVSSTIIHFNWGTQSGYHGTGQRASGATTNLGYRGYLTASPCPPGSPGWNEEAHTCGCPPGQIWNAGAMVCKMDCSAEPASMPSGWTILPAAGVAGTVCVGGCDYRRPSSGIEIKKVVDGITYWSITGWEKQPNESNSCMPGQDSIAYPPADRDNDQTSDDNDVAPDNPGESHRDEGDPTGETQEEGDGSGNNNKSSGGGDCGAPPSSSGDQILAQIAYQTWATRCEVKAQGDKANGDSATGGPTAGGGGDCQSPPIVSGDAVLGMVANQAWATRCAVEAGNAADVSGDVGDCASPFSVTGTNANAVKLRAMRAEICGENQPGWTKGDEPTDPNGDDGEGDDPADHKKFGIGVTADLLDPTDMVGGGTCPVMTLTIMGETISSTEFPYWCEAIAILRALILIFGAYTAVRILMGQIG